jgi:hypothetical protein
MSHNYRRNCAASGTLMIQMSRTTIAAWVLFAAVCAVYLPDIGHGFIRDDVGWVGHNELSSWSDARDLLNAHAGLFRPAVSLSFAAERRACGTSPLCYGLTNFALLIACSAAVFLLARSLSLPDGAALAASAIWIFNWHGISSAVLWISGRTALLLVLFAALSARAFVRGRWLSAALLAGAAMLSKEEAVLLPAALLGWAIIDKWREGASLFSRRNIGFSIASVALWLVYYVWRSHSGALSAATAPSYYRLDFSVARLLSNGPEYLDRSLTFSVAVLVLFWLVHRPGVRDAVRPHRRLLWFAAVWWVCGFAVTMFIPVRSSLYACAPAIGISIAAAAILHEGWRRLDPAARTRAIRAGLAIPIVLWPVYHFRNKDLVDATDVSARMIAALETVAQEHDGRTVVVLKDDRSHRASFDTALGTGLQDAVDLLVTPRLLVWMDPPPADGELAGISSPPARADVTLRLSGGRVVREP